MQGTKITPNTLAKMDLSLFEDIDGKCKHPQEALDVIEVLNEWGNRYSQGLTEAKPQP